MFDDAENGRRSDGRGRETGPRRRPRLSRRPDRSAQDALQRKAVHQDRQYWNMYRKDIYVAPPQRMIPSWLLPLVAFLTILLVVFYLAPRITEGVVHLVNPPAPTGEAAVNQLYGDDTLVVTLPVSDLLADDDIKADRIAQVLYNEPVTKTGEQAAYGFVAVRLQDGTAGFMFSDQLTAVRDSVEPSGHLYRITISASSRRIMSHASRGTLVAEVMMGTELFADYRGDGIYRVQLPGGEKGWISDEGTIARGIDEKIKPPLDLARYFVSSAMAFHRVTRLQNGLTVRGASSAGVARIAGLVNGITLPRTLAAQYKAGSAVAITRNPDTGLIAMDALKTGDLVFFASVPSGTEPDEMGIIMEDGELLMSRRGVTSIRLVNLDQNAELGRLVIGIRRVLPAPTAATSPGAATTGKTAATTTGTTASGKATPGAITTGTTAVTTAAGQA